MSRPRLLALVVAVLMVALSLTSCADESAALDTAVVPAGEVAAAISEGAVAIDVRTPDEFATGHLVDALNIDVTADSFDSRIQALDPSRHYVVYCRSGSRAAQAVERMAALGFADVLNGGGFDPLRAAGLEVS